MGHIIRRVPLNWNHPRDSRGYYKPMFDMDYETACDHWKANYVKFYKRGMDKKCNGEFWDWYGMPPDREFYRPKWTDKEANGYCLYETTTEGTPVSPVFENENDLIKWLYDNQVKLFGAHRYNYLNCEELVKHTFTPHDIYVV